MAKHYPVYYTTSSKTTQHLTTAFFLTYLCILSKNYIFFW